MNRMWMGMGAVAVAGIAIGFALGSARGQQATDLDVQVVATVAAGPEFPGQLLRMRKVTAAPGAILPMHSHQERPEVLYVLAGTLTDTRKGAASTEIQAGQGGANGREVEHMIENKSGKPVVIISVDLIKQ